MNEPGARLRRAARRVLIGSPDPDVRRLQREQGIITMGRRSYSQPTVHYYAGDSTRVRIGSFCSIAEDVELMPGGNHRSDWVSTFPFRIRFGLADAFVDGLPCSKGDIVVGNDVWIGRGARILGGVTVGDGAVVAGFSVVVKDVEPFSIVAGNPAEHRRFRFSEEVQAALLRIQWWNWPDELLIERVADLSSDDVVAFVDRYDPGAGST